MKFLEIAHRGYSEIYKDNTLESLQKAIDYQFDMIEFDIQLTKDEEIIIYHDTFIKTSNGSYFIIDLTLKELLLFDSSIPLLKDLFQYLIETNNTKFPLYLDIKGTKKIVPHLLKVIETYQNDHDFENLYIGSFNLLILELLHKSNKRLNYGIISETMFTFDIFKIFIEKYNIKFFSFHWSVLQHDEINFLRENDILVFTFTNKLDIILKKMIQYNVDGIVTNYKIKN